MLHWFSSDRPIKTTSAAHALLCCLVQSAVCAATVVELSGDCASIQDAINSLPPEGGQIVVRAGTYTCRQPIVINSDNVDLRGEGPATLLRLADGANSPVLVVGDMATPPASARRNIHISDLVIDGNREQQPDECQGGPCGPSRPLRNNGITLRRVSDVAIERVTVVRARSGGLVTEHGCLRIHVSHFTSAINEFDGLAGYETADSVFSNLQLIDNRAAGLSFDIRFNNNILRDLVLVGNRKVGIFMRDSRDNVFHGLQVRNSGEHGIFLAQVDTDPATAATGNTFSAGVVSGSQGAGIRVNDRSCGNNLAVGLQFVSNRDTCVSEVTPGLLRWDQATSICR
jgi:hypothetical protein